MQTKFTISPRQISFFNDHGYLLVEDIIREAEIPLYSEFMTSFWMGLLIPVKTVAIWVKDSENRLTRRP